MHDLVGALPWILAVGHVVAVVIGAMWGHERGRGGEAVALTMFFGIFGVIAVACLPRHPDTTVDALRAVERRLADVAKELREQGSTQNAIAESNMAAAKLLAIIARGVEAQPESDA